MHILSAILVLMVALLHIWILILEMFLWTKPQGLKAFRNTPERAEITRVLAANQGLYNGFLAAGLIWSVIHPDAVMGFQLKLFFLACVVAAALYGAWSALRRILFIQGLPALVALAITLAVANPYLQAATTP